MLVQEEYRSRSDGLFQTLPKGLSAGTLKPFAFRLSAVSRLANNQPEGMQGLRRDGMDAFMLNHMSASAIVILNLGIASNLSRRILMS